ncbi:hypothetical protein B0H13DRAFT_2362879 [Mycena leptocephala]|nr:hypothetical protein B0H13DRAFT_2362879 [Mycena leptocephala]
MPNIPEACLSILPSVLPTAGSNTPIIVLVILLIAAGIIHYVSPMRFTRLLVAAMAMAEKSYLEVLEAGLASLSDIHTAEMLSALQLKVSAIREASLRSSLSIWATICEFLKGRTFSLLQCIREVQALQTQIEACPGLA